MKKFFSHLRAVIAWCFTHAFIPPQAGFYTDACNQATQEHLRKAAETYPSR